MVFQKGHPDYRKKNKEVIDMGLFGRKQEKVKTFVGGKLQENEELAVKEQQYNKEILNEIEQPEQEIQDEEPVQQEIDPPQQIQNDSYLEVSMRIVTIPSVLLIRLIKDNEIFPVLLRIDKKGNVRMDKPSED